MDSIKERFNVTLTKRVKRRLKEIANDQGTSMNQIINQAVLDYIHRVDFEHSTPDFVVDRLNQVLVSQMNLTSTCQAILDELKGDDQV